MQLVYSCNKQPVQTGDVVHVRNTASSTGRVWCRSMDERKYFNEWFPSVIDAEWINRTDQY
jgi:hypothetical protein